MTPDILKKFLDAFNQHDVNAVMSFFDKDAVFVSAYGPPVGQAFSGDDEIRSYFTRFFQSVKNVHFGEDHHCVSGDRGFSDWTLTGTMEVGSPMKVRGCDLFTFKGGKIIRKDTFLKQSR